MRRALDKVGGGLCRLQRREMSATATDIASPSLTLSSTEIDAMVDGILHRQRRSIARAVTLAESTRADHAATVSEILRRLRAHDASATSADGGAFVATQRRIAISGSPGAGKSCFIDALGYHLVENLKLKVGVLAVDPSSRVSGGSILGDKTRMDRLGNHDNAFVRPSPSRGHLGGVTARCWETLEVFEAAKFDVTLVETVGVGQSETEAKHLTDLFVLLVPPASGDDLQGVKKGIVEVADAIIVTKCDGPRRELAETARAHYKRAVMLSRSASSAAEIRRRVRLRGATLAAASHAHGTVSAADCEAEVAEMERRTPVIAVSAEQNYQIDTAWNAIDGLWTGLQRSGELQERRSEQRLEHFSAYLENELVAAAHRLMRSWSADGLPNGTAAEQSLERALRGLVAGGQLTPRAAGDIALKRLLRGT
jgi:LAO/AO transport system kinase